MLAIPSDGTASYALAVPKDAAAWIKKVRLQAELTQDEFAERVRTHRVTVANWERGASDPEFASIQQILRAFPGSVALLAGDATHHQAPPMLKTLEARELAHLIDRLPQQLRVYLRDMVYRVLGEQKPTLPAKAKPPAS